MSKNVDIVELTSADAMAVVGGAKSPGALRNSPLTALRQFLKLVVADFREVFGRPVKTKAELSA